MTDLIHALNFAEPVVQGWLPLAIGGLSLLGSFFGGRSKSKQHERQLSSEERRHEQSLRARERELERRSADWREYAESQIKAQKAFRERQADALRNLVGGGGLAGVPGGGSALAGGQTGLAGVPAGFDFGSLAMGGGNALMPPNAGMPAGAALPLVTAGRPAGADSPTGGMLDYLAMSMATNPDLMGGLGGGAQAPLPTRTTGLPPFLAPGAWGAGALPGR